MSQPSSRDDSNDSTTSPGRTRGPDEAFCRDCGAVISAKAEICPECGVRQRDPPKSSVDSALDELLEGGNPFVAGALSALFPGVGQLYNRQLGKALAFIVGGMVAAFSIVIGVGLVLFPAVWIYGIYEAYKTAERQAEERERTEDAAVGVDVREEGAETDVSDDTDG